MALDLFPFLSYSLWVTQKLAHVHVCAQALIHTLAHVHMCALAHTQTCTNSNAHACKHTLLEDINV
jgi:hypothetical protein